MLPSFRSGPLLIRLTREALRLANEQGLDGIYGLPNAASLPVVSRFLKGRDAGQLRVHLSCARPAVSEQAVTSTAARELDGVGARRLMGLFLSARQDERRWNAESLLVRLRSPLTSFAVHVCEEGLAISSMSLIRGVRFMMLCGFLPRTGTVISRRAVKRLTRAACHFHGALPFCYVGVNRYVRALPGVAVPLRFYPSPLKLLSRALAPGLYFAPARFELVDTDVV